MSMKDSHHAGNCRDAPDEGGGEPAERCSTGEDGSAFKPRHPHARLGYRIL